jgi:hypothetical protein
MKNVFSACFSQIEELFVYVKMRVSWRFRMNDRFMSKKFAITSKYEYYWDFRHDLIKRKNSKRTRTKVVMIFCQSYQALSTIKIIIILRCYKSYFLLINQYWLKFFSKKNFVIFFLFFKKKKIELII